MVEHTDDHLVSISRNRQKLHQAFPNWGKYNVNIFYQHTCIGVGVDQTGGRRNEPEVGRGMFGTGTKSGRRTSFRTGRNIEGEKI